MDLQKQEPQPPPSPYPSRASLLHGPPVPTFLGRQQSSGSAYLVLSAGQNEDAQPDVDDLSMPDSEARYGKVGPPPPPPLPSSHPSKADMVDRPLPRKPEHSHSRSQKCHRQYCFLIPALFLSLVAILFMALALATTEWREMTIEEDKLKEIYAQDPGLAALDNGLDPLYHSRGRGIFRTCYEGNPRFLQRPKEAGVQLLGVNCVLDRGIIIPETAERNDWGQYSRRRDHLVRVQLSMCVICIVMLLVAAGFGAAAIIQVRRSFFRKMASLFCFLAALCAVLVMVTFHVAIKLEDENITKGPFKANWGAREPLASVTTVAYGMSYIDAWIGTGLAFVAAILYVYAGHKIHLRMWCWCLAHRIVEKRREAHSSDKSLISEEGGEPYYVPQPVSQPVPLMWMRPQAYAVPVHVPYQVPVPYPVEVPVKIEHVVEPVVAVIKEVEVRVPYPVDIKQETPGPNMMLAPAPAPGMLMAPSPTTAMMSGPPALPAPARMTRSLKTNQRATANSARMKSIQVAEKGLSGQSSWEYGNLPLYHNTRYSMHRPTSRATSVKQKEYGEQQMSAYITEIE